MGVDGAIDDSGDRVSVSSRHGRRLRVTPIQQQLDGRRTPTLEIRGESLGNHDHDSHLREVDQLLDAGGWKRGADGVRARDGKRLKMLFQTVTNAQAQRIQAVIKQAAAKAGIEMELKSVTASVCFSSDVANPDTYPHFYADIQMYNTTMTAPDPQYFMNQFTSWEVASKDNKWQGRNITRWTSEEYDKLYAAAEGELDPVADLELKDRLLGHQRGCQQTLAIEVFISDSFNFGRRHLRAAALPAWLAAQRRFHCLLKTFLADLDAGNQQQRVLVFLFVFGRRRRASWSGRCCAAWPPSPACRRRT